MTPIARGAAPAILALATALLAAAAQAADLEVVLRGIHSADGQALVALHQHRSGNLFPSEAGIVARQALPAGTDDVRVVFSDLPPGKYAVAAFHDVNGDGELNTNFAGLPDEGYGFSNDAQGFMGPPGFEAAAVSLGAANGVHRIVVTIRCPESPS